MNSTQQNSMKFNIQLMNGNKIPMEIDKFTNGADLKKLMNEKVNGQNGNYVYAGRQIDDAKLYDIEGETINLVLRFRGG